MMGVNFSLIFYGSFVFNTVHCGSSFRHIEYCMHRVNLLRHNGVKPILVFDGGLLPMKGEQENKRGRYARNPLKSQFHLPW